MASRLRTLGPRLATFDTSSARVPPKTADAIYSTGEFRVWRTEVVRRAGFRCEKCGHGGKLYADHVVELKDGGAPFDPKNAQALCAVCHGRKSNAERAKRLAQRF